MKDSCIEAVEQHSQRSHRSFTGYMRCDQLFKVEELLCKRFVGVLRSADDCHTVNDLAYLHALRLFEAKCHF